jgi:CRISPR-associated endoribonuclease Cas6
MRLLVKLRSGTNQRYPLNMNHKFHGFVYNLLRGTEYEVLHDKLGFKFFCFSNIFPLMEKNGVVPPISEGETRNFIISSPSSAFIKTVSEKLKKNQEVRIGDSLFSVEGQSRLSPRINQYSRIASSTPIVIRIPEEKYDLYSVPQELRKKRYAYWKAEIDFTAFIKQLEENLFKKYNEFHKETLEPFTVFEQFRYTKQVVNRLTIGGKDYPVVGSMWEFSFSYLSERQKKLLEFGLDCGFGERNTYGFGFVNIVRNKRV